MISLDVCMNSLRMSCNTPLDSVWSLLLYPFGLASAALALSSGALMAYTATLSNVKGLAVVGPTSSVG